MTVLRSKPEMKESCIDWIGMIPKDWMTPKLLHVLRKKISDGPHETPNYVNDGIPFISIDSLNESKEIDFSVCKRFITEEDYIHYSQKTVLEEGDVLFSKAATIGKTAIVGKEKFMIWSPLAIIKNKPDRIYNSFLYYLMNCSELVKAISLSGSMNTQINVGMREIEQIRIPLPSLQEQQTIADYLEDKLSRIDDLIIEAESMIDDYKQLRTAVITAAITKGLDPDIDLKESGVEWIGEIPTTWKVCSIKHVTTKIGSGKTPLGGAEVYSDEGVVFLRSQNIYNTGLNLEEVSHISEEIDNTMQGTRIQYRDVLLNITGGSIGRCCLYDLVDVPANVNQHVCIIRADNKKLLPEYLRYFWNSSLGTISVGQHQTGGNRPGLNFEQIGSTKIPICDISTQEAIVKHLDEKCKAIDSIIEEKECLIADLESYKKTLLFEVVTGKRKVS